MVDVSSFFESVADGLSNAGYAIVDNFLFEEETDAILQSDDFKSGLLQFRQAGIGKNNDKQINEAIRNDLIQWVDRKNAGPQIMVYLDRLEHLISYLNQSLFLSLKDYEVHKTIYPVGSFYKRHLDQFKKDDHRKLSVILYLNTEWKQHHGGQLRIYHSTGTIDVLPKAGRLVCFRSDQLEHEVMPALRERLSITGWILDQFADVKHLS